MEIFSQELIGAIMIGVMLFAIFIGFPISFTLIFLGLVFGYWGFGKLVFYLMTLQFNMIMTESTLQLQFYVQMLLLALVRTTVGVISLRYPPGGMFTRKTGGFMIT